MTAPATPYALHLDVCARCRSRHWDLCAAGWAALRRSLPVDPLEPTPEDIARVDASAEMPRGRRRS